jgi:N6-L-threonylcarbamoyladenine synthase
MDIACAFEDAVTQVLVAKTIKAADDYGARTVVVGGGVSANTYIRQRLAEALEEAGHIQLLVPPPDLATDNAIMIALPGYFHAIKKDFADAATLRANGNLRLV